MRISDWSSDVCSSDLCDKFLSLRISEEDYERLRKAARKAKVRSISAYVRELIRAAVGGTSILDVILDAELREINRSDERRVGKECVSTCRSWWSPHH